MSVLRGIQKGAEKVASGREVTLTLEQDTAMQKGDGPEGGYIFGPLSEFSQLKPATKKLDAQIAQEEGTESKRAEVGSDAMTYQANSKPLRAGTPNANVTSKTSSVAGTLSNEWAHGGDLSQAQAPVAIKVANADCYTLPSKKRYPIDSVHQVKRACSYFDENIHNFDLADRRVYAQSVLSRSEELGVKVAGAVLDYGGNEYGPHIEGELHARIASFEGTEFGGAYEALLDGFGGGALPAVMVEMLKLCDDQSGASESYGRMVTGFRDPFAAVYGQPKVAAEQPEKADVYSWRSGGDYVTGQMLKALASRKADLDTEFGGGFSKSFEKDPVSIFESMPDPQKVLLSRLASDNSSQTFRI